MYQATSQPIYSKNHVHQIAIFREHQAQETLGILSQLSKKEEDKCSYRSDAATATLRSYYAQRGTTLYNLDKDPEALLSLPEARETALQTAKKLLDLSITVQFSLYVYLEDGVLP